MGARMAKKEDFVELHKLILRIFPQSGARISEKDGFFVVDGKDGLAGFAHYTEDGKRIILRGFGVAEGERKHGYGGMLLDALLAHAGKAKKSVFLKAKIRNPAVRLYCSKGFCFKRLKGETLTMVFRIAN